MDDQVGRVLAEVWRGTGGYVFLPQKRGSRWLEDEGHRWPDPLQDEWDFNWPERDWYFCPLVFSEPHRQARYALPTHVLWADLDEASPEKCLLRPSIAWRTTQGGIPITSQGGYASGGVTKPHWQALWLLGEEAYESTFPRAHTHGSVRDAQDSDMMSEAEAGTYCPACEEPERPTGMARQIISAQAAASLSKRIAYAEPGADRSGWDVTQVLRLPGTLNHKHTPPQPVKLLWAKRLYYTVEQIRAAYPPVPDRASATGSDSNGAAGWHEFTPAEIAAALRALPMGVQMALERDDGGADRSLELFRLARELLTWKVAPDMTAALLEMSALGRSKYGSRKDGRQRLLTTVADAMADE